jgi:uncharacterized protein (DUF302 family)
MKLGMKKQLTVGYDEALAKLPDALQTEGFGVVTEIDMKETLKKKLDLDFRRYKIVGACNPQLAHRALSAELEVGLMLPCNVVVHEGDDRRAVVTAIDPMQTVAAQLPALRGIAEEVRARLARVLERL